MENLNSTQQETTADAYTRRQLNIGLFGFGCVGQGLYGVLNDTQGVSVRIDRIVVRQPNKERPLPPERFHYQPEAILNHRGTDAVVELIDRADDAFVIASAALREGKSVVSANKKMIAENLPELVDLQRKYGGALLYEASCAGSIPIIRNLEEYYDNDHIDKIEGILNGTCNYILTRMQNEGADFAPILADAQHLGFAESDPTLDIDGHDAKYKLCILTLHAFGLFLQPIDVLNIGIRKVTANDFQFAREKGYKIQLVAKSQRVGDRGIVSYVLPRFVSLHHHLYNVAQEYNGVIVQTAFAQQQFFVGKGAGGYPTASAVLSDLSALTHNYRYDYKKIHQQLGFFSLPDNRIRAYIRYSVNSQYILKEMGLVDVEVRYTAGDYNYVIGTISLAQLRSLQSILNQEDIFIAEMPDAE